MRNIIAVYFLIPMYFSARADTYVPAGQEPATAQQAIYADIPGGVSIYNVVVTRVFFETTISEELYESARIDGAQRLPHVLFDSAAAVCADTGGDGVVLCRGALE